MLFKLIKSILFLHFLRFAFLLSGLVALALTIGALFEGNTKDGVLTLTVCVLPLV
jgi:hypothetical protein